MRCLTESRSLKTVNNGGRQRMQPLHGRLIRMSTEAKADRVRLRRDTPC
jgi:hypothetical protein